MLNCADAGITGEATEIPILERIVFSAVLNNVNTNIVALILYSERRWK